MVLLGLVADGVGLSSEPGIGGLQVVSIVVGTALVLWGALFGRPRARRGLSRLYALLVSVYAALWLLELLLTYPLDPTRGFHPPGLSMQGMYEEDQKVGYRHVAGYRGTFDDGILQIPIRINSRGDRDDEPRDAHPIEDRLVLIGDSFTFGQGLRSDETIDHRIEQRSGGKVDAYSLGVMGYGTLNSLLRLEESSWWRGRAVYYLFFENDLEDANARPDYYAVHDGVLVPRFRPDGERYAPEQWAGLLASVRERHTQGTSRLGNTFSLERLRKVAAQAFDRNLRLTGISAELVKASNIEAAIEATAKIEAHARRRGARFTVVILPVVGEAAAGEYSDWARAYIDGVTGRGIEVLEVLDQLEGDDYLAHDPHFNAKGADKVAATILDHFERSAPAASP